MSSYLINIKLSWKEKPVKEMLLTYLIPQISWGLILINKYHKENGPGTTIMMVLFLNPNS
jgi:hypothetical protein